MWTARCKIFLDILSMFDLSFDDNPNIQCQYCQSWVKITHASFVAGTPSALLDGRMWRCGQPNEPMGFWWWAGKKGLIQRREIILEVVSSFVPSVLENEGCSPAFLLSSKEIIPLTSCISYIDLGPSLISKITKICTRCSVGFTRSPKVGSQMNSGDK